jgi:hypothetical protein
LQRWWGTDREQVPPGTISLNHFGLAMPETPFGGIKDSGWGSEDGIEGLQACPGQIRDPQENPVKNVAHGLISNDAGVG